MSDSLSDPSPDGPREALPVIRGEEEPCAYLPEEAARLVYRRMPRCSPETYVELLERGWRRFGEVFFRPACAACAECRSLRLEVEAFQPSRSQRRAWKRNEDLQVLLREPSLTRDHLSLYDRYHQDMVHRRGWPGHGSSPEDYFHTFVQGHGDYGRELAYFLDGRLVAVALTDLLPGAISAVYCYYDPSLRARGLGVYSVLRQAALARELGLAHLYLGYLVEGNASMRYKARYRPHRILRGRPDLDASPDWTQPVQRP